MTESRDFGYTGQKYFRSTWPVYRCKASAYVAFPFGMEKMVREGIITEEQLLKFMQMLEGDNNEIERLAMVTLTELCKMHKIESLI